jgi:hypothetical protein
MFVWKRRISYLHLWWAIFSKPIDFEIGEIVYRKYENQKRILKHGLWIRRNRCVWLRILVLWPSGEITSLIKLQGKPSLFTLPHCTDPFNFRNSSNSSANAQKCEYSCTIICKSFRGNTYNKSKVRRYWNCLSFISIYSCRNIYYVTLCKRLTTIVFVQNCISKIPLAPQANPIKKI